MHKTAFKGVTQMKKIILLATILLTISAQAETWIYEKPHVSDEIGYIKMATLRGILPFTPIMAVRNHPQHGKSVVWALVTGYRGGSAVYTGMMDQIEVVFDKEIEKTAFFDVGYSLDRRLMILNPNEVRAFLDRIKKAGKMSIKISTTEGTYFIHYSCAGFDENIIEWNKPKKEIISKMKIDRGI